MSPVPTRGWPTSFVKEVWRERRTEIKVLAGDLLIFISIMVVLMLGKFVLDLAQTLGLATEFLHSIHYWAYVTAYVLFLTAFLRKLLAVLFRQIK
jgi:cobalamin biosynthesis protein CobD/CbiB